MNFKTILFFIFTFSPLYWNSHDLSLKNLILTVFFIIVSGFSFIIIYYLLCILLPEVLSDMFDWLKIYFDKLISKYFSKKPKRIVSERQLRRRRTKKAFFMSQQQNKSSSKRFYHRANRIILFRHVETKDFIRKSMLSNHSSYFGIKLAELIL
jgi:hypothetical protein